MNIILVSDSLAKSRSVALSQTQVLLIAFGILLSGFFLAMVTYVVTMKFAVDLRNPYLRTLLAALHEDDVPAGVYHGCASGRTTWHGLATAVFEGLGAGEAGAGEARAEAERRVRRTTSEAFVRPAPRPAFSVLDLTGWEKVGLPPMRPWDVALAEFLPTLAP